MDRRNFIKNATVIASAYVITDPALVAGENKIPWYKSVTRWGQTNISEKDPAHYDIAWWRKHWKYTQTQGVIVNVGGIVAYYPSKVKDLQTTVGVD